MSTTDPTDRYSRTAGTGYDYTEQRIERLEKRVRDVEQQNREIEQQNWELKHELGWLKTYFYTAVVWGVATVVIFGILLAVS